MAGGKVVALLGVGDFGVPVASNLLHAGFTVRGFDVAEPALGALNSVIKTRSSSFAEASKDASILLVMSSSPTLVGNLGLATDSAISELSHGAIVFVCSTIAPSSLIKLKQHMSEERKDLLWVDAPISRTLDGKLRVIASGDDEAMLGGQAILSAMTEDHAVVKGELGESCKFNTVKNALVGMHLAAAAEAVALGASSGLDTAVLYNIISTAAGSSTVFAKLVPHMLNNDSEPVATLDDVAQHLDTVFEEAKELRFPLPLTSAAYQQVLLGCSLGYGEEDCASVFKIWKEKNPPTVPKRSMSVDELSKEASKLDRVAFIGLGAMGFGMATHLVKQGFTVQGFDVYEPALQRFVKAGGKSSNSPEEAVKGVDVVIVMVTNENQAESVLFGHKGAVKALVNGSTVILCSTVSPEYVRKVEERLIAEGRGLHVVDAPVSGGVAKAANGTLTIMAGASYEALKHAGRALIEMSENLYILDGGVGVGSSVKMVNQLLAGVHIAASAEAMALGARLGLETRSLYEFIMNSDGSSWMFGNRVPHMLDSDYTPLSALDIFVKDLGIVFAEGKRQKVPLPLASNAYQQFLLGSTSGSGREDDSAVVKLFEKLTNVSVGAKPVAASPSNKSPNGLVAEVAKHQSLSKDITLGSLPSEWPEDPLVEIHRAEKEGNAKVLVVLDDDATGTQTVNGVTVLTDWEIDAITEELKKSPDCLFILTNSRAFSVEKATELTKEICKNVMAAAAAAGNVGYTIVLRGDSTLRGHFPEEADAATSVLGETDAWIICPFFLQGGRYTIHDIHYVADGNRLDPAGNTEFAGDAVFGYRSSNLREWVEEKMKGRVAANDVASVSIDTIRKAGPEAVCEQLCWLKKGTICVVNAASERDVQVFAAGMIRAEAKGKSFLCRTAAGFVSARVGLKPKLPKPTDLGPLGDNGGLIIVGSYVPKTTSQIEEVKASIGKHLEWITVSVAAVTSEVSSVRESEILHAATIADLSLASGRDTVIMTSRQLLTGASVSENIRIGSSTASALVEIMSRIQTRPRYVLAKGGITSSDMATKPLRARKALVVGQALPGVPLWQLGEGSRYPGLPYIVFPGNVGGPDAITQVIKTWSKSLRKSTKELLSAAKCGGYAIGAFNIYNLEGVQAVVAAAEAEQSPAILQIHPAALKNGGAPLVACCVAAANAAQVPITVHLDHGTDEKGLLQALSMGFDSIMVDGSSLSVADNILFTQRIVNAAHSMQIITEAELGRLSGTEDGLTIEEYEAHLTDVHQADEFLRETGVDALAVCVGNVHGKYPASGPALNLDLLQELHVVAERHDVQLVLHGASGLSADLVKACIERGVTKFNVNTEVRGAYMKAVQSPHRDLVNLLESSKSAMQSIIVEKIRLFGSSAKA
ncbi:unnamed protein product [Calypogeia fissa]